MQRLRGKRFGELLYGQEVRSPKEENERRADKAYMRDGNVYFIRDGRGNIKIGVSQDVDERLHQLQTANPNKLEVVMCLHVPRLDHAYAIETELHKRFGSHRKNGEWFDEQPIRRWIDDGNIQVLGYEFK